MAVAATFATDWRTDNGTFSLVAATSVSMPSIHVSGPNISMMYVEQAVSKA